MVPTVRMRPGLRHAWLGPSLLVMDEDGGCGTASLTGFYFRETRFLRHLALEVAGEAPFLCSSSQASPETLDFVYVHPELRTFGGGGSDYSGQEGKAERYGGLLARGLDLRLRIRVRPARLEAELLIGNRAGEAAEFEVAWLVGADFADLLEAHEGKRQLELGVAVDPGRDGVRFRCLHPELPLESRVWAEGPGEWTFADGRLSTRVSLAHGAEERLVLHAAAWDLAEPIDDSGADARESAVARWRAGAARVRTPEEGPLTAALATATEDLGAFALLEGGEDEWLAPAAGVPLYPALFGRDALVTGWQAMLLDGGQMASAALARLAGLQGTVDDPSRDEEPGRIVQQVRRGPVARLGITPFARYYGDVASPFDFVTVLGLLYAWNGEREGVLRHWDAARRVLDWARERGDMDGDGYVEYLTRSPQGPEHQGWKDSGRAVIYRDGRDVRPPLAVCEVQGYWYAALQVAAVLAGIVGAPGDGVAYWREADELKERFNRDFWMEDEGYFALALDEENRPVRSIASNAGQCLATGIVSADNAPRMVERLFRRDLWSGWGIRTLSSDHPAYSPLSYHRGSVWPVENASIAFGLRRYGFDRHLHRLAEGMVGLHRLFPGGRVPECVGGFSREELPHPGVYPRANVPQAWNQSAPALLLQALLGLFPVAPLKLLLVDPVLPPWLPDVRVEGLRVGDATVTLRFHRDPDGRSHVEKECEDGKLRILRQPPPGALDVGVAERLAKLFRG